MRKYLAVVDRHRSQKLIRFANFIIDRAVVYFIFIIFGFASSLVFALTGINFFIEIVQEMAGVNRFMDILITSTVYFIYIFLIEYFTKGRSLGKYITGTKVICTDGTDPTIKDYFIRNISRLIPFDVLSFLGENGWHDSWSETRVINIKNYNTERQTKREIEDLGKKEIA
nr:RDD family protein [uncultured Chryseobacterium sp.]